jgi:hypothetical protein
MVMPLDEGAVRAVLRWDHLTIKRREHEGG